MSEEQIEEIRMLTSRTSRAGSLTSASCDDVVPPSDELCLSDSPSEGDPAHPHEVPERRAA